MCQEELGPRFKTKNMLGGGSQIQKQKMCQEELGLRFKKNVLGGGGHD